MTRSAAVGQLGFVLLAAACVAADLDVVAGDAVAPHADRRLDALTSSRLERFESEGAFSRYLERVRKAALERGYWWASPDGRIFALSGTELIEGQLEGGRIREVRRLNLTDPPPERRRSGS